MSSRAVEYPRASAALAGLGLTTQLAAAATDSIPIAKLVLSVVSRIITLAEDIETSRDALHQLAESARTLGRSISAVVAGRKLTPEVERRLEAIYEALRSIETLFTRHKAKSAFYKALSYAFTTKKHVESLSQELSRATQELICIAVVDTNAQLWEDSRYIGEFRRIRLCDVKELTLISEDKIWFTSYSSQLFSGRVKGDVVVIRCYQRNSPIGPGEESYSDKRLRQEIIGHDQLLEKLSIDLSFHPNIARLYGKNLGEHIDRFNVLKSGFSRISKFNARRATIDSTWNVISQLVDATCWLEHKGLTWYPESSSTIFIDSAGVPIIGLHNDLSACDAKSWRIFVLGDMLEHAYSAHWKRSQPRKHALDIIFGTALVPKGIYREGITILRGLIPTLDGKICTYIKNTLQSLRDPWDVWARTGAVILHAAASGRTVGSTFYTKYIANLVGRLLKDGIFMARVDESETEVVHWTVSAEIPTSTAETFRKKLGITVEGPPTLGDILVSYGDPAEPASMRFTSPYP